MVDRCSVLQSRFLQCKLASTRCRVAEVIAASCYAQTGLSSTTVDVDLHSKQALRGDSAGMVKIMENLLTWWMMT